MMTNNKEVKFFSHLIFENIFTIFDFSLVSAEKCCAIFIWESQVNQRHLMTRYFILKDFFTVLIHGA